MASQSLTSLMIIIFYTSLSSTSWIHALQAVLSRTTLQRSQGHQARLIQQITGQYGCTLRKLEEEQEEQ